MFRKSSHASKRSSSNGNHAPRRNAGNGNYNTPGRNSSNYAHPRGDDSPAPNLTTDTPGALPSIGDPNLSSPSSTPSNGAPSNGAPSNGAPSNGGPSNGAPTEGGPADRLDTDALTFWDPVSRKVTTASFAGTASKRTDKPPARAEDKTPRDTISRDGTPKDTQSPGLTISRDGTPKDTQSPGLTISRAETPKDTQSPGLTISRDETPRDTQSPVFSKQTPLGSTAGEMPPPSPQGSPDESLGTVISVASQAATIGGGLLSQGGTPNEIGNVVQTAVGAAATTLLGGEGAATVVGQIAQSAAPQIIGKALESLGGAAQNAPGEVLSGAATEAPSSFVSQSPAADTGPLGEATSTPSSSTKEGVAEGAQALDQDPSKAAQQSPQSADEAPSKEGADPLEASEQANDPSENQDASAEDAQDEAAEEVALEANETGDDGGLEKDGATEEVALEANEASDDGGLEKGAANESTSPPVDGGLEKGAANESTSPLVDLPSESAASVHSLSEGATSAAPSMLSGGIEPAAAAAVAALTAANVAAAATSAALGAKGEGELKGSKGFLSDLLGRSNAPSTSTFQPPPGQAPPKEVKPIPLGENFYLWTTAENPAKRAPHLIISTHGGYWESKVAKHSEGSHTKVPEDTSIHFYVPHGTALENPGLEQVLGLKPTESFGAGSEVVNYGLTKFQEKNKKGGETYEQIQQDVGTIEGRLQGQKEGLRDLGIDVDDSSQQADLDQILESKQQSLKDAHDDAMDRLTNATDAADKQAIAAELQQLDKDINKLKTFKGSRQLEHFDVLTVRDRPFKSGVTLQDALDALRSEGWKYEEVHANFCRSPVRIPYLQKPAPSGSAPEDTQWSRPQGGRMQPQGNAPSTSTPQPTSAQSNQAPSTSTPQPTSAQSNQAPSTSTPQPTSAQSNQAPSTSTPQPTSSAEAQDGTQSARDSLDGELKESIAQSNQVLDQLTAQSAQPSSPGATKGGVTKSPKSFLEKLLSKFESKPKTDMAAPPPSAPPAEFFQQSLTQYPDKNLCGFYAARHFHGSQYTQADFVDAGAAFYSNTFGMPIGEARQMVLDGNDPAMVRNALENLEGGSADRTQDEILADPSVSKIVLPLKNKAHFITILKGADGQWWNYDSLQSAPTKIADLGQFLTDHPVHEGKYITRGGQISHGAAATSGMAKPSSAPSSPSEQTPSSGQTPQTQSKSQGTQEDLPGLRKIKHEAPEMSGEDQARLDRVKEFLSTQSTLRVGFEVAPGYGHQAASVATMDAIRQLGYEGWFDVYYQLDDNRDVAKSNRSKIAALMPGDFDPNGPPIQVSPGKKLRFIGIGTNETPKKTGGVGVMGANDHPTQTGKSTSDRLNVDHALTLQPFEWHQARTVESHGQKQPLEADRDSTAKMRESPLAFQYDVNSPDDPIALVDQQLAKDPVKANNLKTLLRGVGQNKHELQAVYGLADIENELAALIDGARWAQSQPGSTVGGVVLAAIQNIPDQFLPKDKDVTVLELDSPGTADRLANVKPGEVILLKTGRLDKALFDELYRVSTLPPVLEGASTANFMRLTGLPYLNFETTKTPYVAPKTGDHQPVLQMLREAETTTRSKSADRAEAVGRVMLEAKNPSSPLNDFFSAGGQETRSASSNMVVMGLDALRAAAEQAPPPLKVVTGPLGLKRISQTITNYLVKRNRALEGHEGDVKTLVRQFVHDQRAKATAGVPSPDDDPRGFAHWLEGRSPFNGEPMNPSRLPLPKAAVESFEKLQTLLRDGRYIDPHKLISPHDSNPTTPGEWNPTHYEWYLDQATLLDAYRSVADDAVKKQLGMLMLHSFYKAAAIHQEKAEEQGRRVTPLQSESGGSYHRSATTPLVEKVHVAYETELGFPSNERTPGKPDGVIHLVDNARFREVLAREYSSPNLSPSQPINTLSDLGSAVRGLLQGLAHPHDKSASNRVFLDISKLLDAKLDGKPLNHDAVQELAGEIEKTFLSEVNEFLKGQDAPADRAAFVRKLGEVVSYSMQVGAFTEHPRGGGRPILVTPHLFDGTLTQRDTLPEEMKDIILPVRGYRHDVLTRRLVDSIAKTGYRIDPVSAMEAWLDVETVEEIFQKEGIPLTTLGTGRPSAPIPEVHKSFQNFLGEGLSDPKATTTFANFKKFADRPELAREPTVQILSQGVVAVLEGLGKLEKQPGVDITRAFDDKKVGDLLQLAYFRIEQAMREVMALSDAVAQPSAVTSEGEAKGKGKAPKIDPSRKGERSSFHFLNQIELIHQQVQAILEIASPYQDAHFESGVLGYLGDTIPNGLKPHVEVYPSALHTLATTLAGVEAQKGSNALNVAVLQDHYYESVAALDHAGAYDVVRLDGATVKGGAPLGDGSFTQGAADTQKTLADIKGRKLDVFLGDFRHNISETSNVYAIENLEHQVDQLFENDLVAEKFTVVIDNTIDKLKSDQIESFLEHNRDRIEQGKLNVAIFRSAQKFDMLGMDNYYGGFVVAVNDPKEFAGFRGRIQDPNDRLKGLNRQGLTHLLTHAGKNLDQYRDRIMQNTKALYEAIPAAFRHDPEVVPPATDILDKMRVSMIEGDDKQVFLDIDFNPNGHGYYWAFLRHFQDFIRKNDLPVDSRASFGFVTSNLSGIETMHKVRFNPGLENQEQLEKYAEFFSRWVDFVAPRVAAGKPAQKIVEELDKKGLGGSSTPQWFQTVTRWGRLASKSLLTKLEGGKSKAPPAETRQIPPGEQPSPETPKPVAAEDALSTPPKSQHANEAPDGELRELIEQNNRLLEQLTSTETSSGATDLKSSKGLLSNLLGGSSPSPSSSRQPAGQAASTGVRQIPLGEHFYLWTTAENPGERAPNLIISTHGGFSESKVAKHSEGSHTQVPTDTSIHFYVPHGTALQNPGLEQVLGLKPTESFGAGSGVVNYQLTKFQEENKPDGETYGQIEHNVGRIEKRIQDQRQGLQDLGIDLDDPSQLANVDQIIEDRKKAIDEAIADAETKLGDKALDAADRTRIEGDLKRLHLDRATLKVTLGTRQYESFDVLTVRKRPFKGGVTLQDALDALRSEGWNYQDVHANFCRSPIRYPWQEQAPSGAAPWDEQWSRPPGGRMQPQGDVPTADSAPSVSNAEGQSSGEEQSSAPSADDALDRELAEAIRLDEGSKDGLLTFRVGPPNPAAIARDAAAAAKDRILASARERVAKAPETFAGGKVDAELVRIANDAVRAMLDQVAAKGGSLDAAAGNLAQAVAVAMTDRITAAVKAAGASALDSPALGSSLARLAEDTAAFVTNRASAAEDAAIPGSLVDALTESLAARKACGC